MHYEECEYSPQFYCVRGLNKGVIDYLRLSVKQSFRFYRDSAWFIHSSQVLNLTQYGYGEFGYVDYSALPDDLQMEIAREKGSWHLGATKKDNFVVKEIEREAAFRVLHLQPEAPAYVVAAVWRALAKKHHPDVGGDEEQFKKYRAAYDTVKG